MKRLIFLTCLIWAGLAFARTERVIIQGDHGKLVADLQTPDVLPKKCPIVILCHGFTGNRNGGLEVGIAHELETKGIASIRFDFNGHGESEGDFQQMTGVVTAMLAGQLGKKAFKGGVVLLAPAGVIRDDAIRGQTGGQQGSLDDPQNPPEYVEVWGHRLGRDYITTAFWLPIYETAAGYKGPACIVHGTSDRTVPYTYGLRFHQQWKRSEWHLLDHYDHGFRPHPEEAVKLAVAFFTKTLH